MARSISRLSRCGVCWPVATPIQDGTSLLLWPLFVNCSGDSAFSAGPPPCYPSSAVTGASA